MLINTFFIKQTLLKVGLIGLTGLTLASGATGIARVTKNLSSQNQPVPEVKGASSINTSTEVSENGLSAIVNDAVGSVENVLAKAGNVVKTAVTPSPKPFSSPLAVAVNSAANASASSPTTNPNACIITLFGLQYDVAPLRSTHPGGDIFVCGTDMTTVYQGQHGTDVSRMQPYLVTTSGGSTSGSGGGSSSGIHRDDDEEEENEDERMREAVNREANHSDDGGRSDGEFDD